MLVLYTLGNFIGYFLIMIIFLSIGIISGKSKGAWIWYSIGAVLQLLSLIGNQATANMYGKDTSLYWVIYILLLIIAAGIINSRYNNSSDKSDISDEGEKFDCKFVNVDNGNENKIYSICIFDTEAHTLRKENKNIDITKFPPSKFADNNTYYAIETFRDGKKVRIYYTKDNWDKQIEAEISEEKK